MKNKKILEICLSPNLGGLELFMLSCVSGFSKYSEVITVVAPSKKLDSYLNSNEVIKIKRNKLFPIFPAFKLSKVIDEQEIDLVHFHWTRDITTVVLAKVLSKRKPKIIQSRHMTMTRFKDDIYHKWLYKNIDLMHAVTNQVKEQLEKFIPLDIQPMIKRVYLGTKIPMINKNRVLALNEEYGLEESFVIGIVGRIEEGKGQYLLLEALAKLNNKKIKILIVGQAMENSYLLELETKCKELGIKEQVIFSGFTKEVNEHMTLCDVTVLATPKETFGLVVIESMANRVPVIATNNGGPLEIIEDGIDGILFDRTSTDLAEKIDILYHDEVLKEKITMNALETVIKKFNYKNQINQLYKIIIF